MTQDAHYRPTAHRVLLPLEIICASASLFLLAGGVYGLYANFQPNIQYVAAMRGSVVLTWLPIGAFILTDVMLFRRDIAKMFISRAVGAILTLFLVTFLGSLFFWNAGLPAWRSLDATGPSHAYSYTIVDKAAQYESWLCPGAITISSHIWFKDTICAPDEIWRAAEIGAGLTLFGTWTPEGLRYSSVELKR